MVTVVLDHEAQRLPYYRAGIRIPTGRDLIADMLDERFGQGDVERVFRGHTAAYSHM